MPALTFANHLLNFLAPAIFLALLLGLVARVVWRKALPLLPWGEQMALNAVLGAVVLGVGLVLEGRDGRMATYAALVVAMATCQWVMVRGWRPSVS